MILSERITRQADGHTTERAEHTQKVRSREMRHGALAAVALATTALAALLSSSWGQDNLPSGSHSCIQAAAWDLDFGDAPDARYRTTLAQDGARHAIVPGVLLGRGLDGETDGEPNATATGDDNYGIDDEDGVIFGWPLYAGREATLDVTVTVPGYLNAWVDFDADGAFGPGEQVFIDQFLTPGANALALAIPAEAAAGGTFARFRFSTEGSLDSFGPAADGEVEDHYLQILANPDFQAPNDSKDGLVVHLMDHRDNLADEEAGVWFWFPDDPPQVQPWSRMPQQDWGWMHDVSARVPPRATGIDSAMLILNAWDVDVERGEDDVIYANDRKLGLLDGLDQEWQLCPFPLPAELLSELWRDGKLSVYIDIDRIVEMSGGNRVTLGSSTLVIQYTLSDPDPMPAMSPTP